MELDWSFDEGLEGELEDNENPKGDFGFGFEDPDAKRGVVWVVVCKDIERRRSEAERR